MTQIITLFAIEGTPISCERYGEGHINDTFLVKCENPNRSYILQRINNFVFKDIPSLMENYAMVTSYMAYVLINQGINPHDRVLELIPTTSGDAFVYCDRGYFRMLRFVADSITLQRAQNATQMMLAGHAFGTFQNLLSSLDASKLHETIPDFHHTPKRYSQFLVALEKATPERLGKASDLITYVLSQKHVISIIQDALDDQSIKLRVTHNDTKLNNLLFAQDLESVKCVIDLDTIMPGSLLFDFGDAIRFGCNTAPEDDPDSNHIAFDMPYFIAYATGFISALKETLTNKEASMLVDGALMMTFEVGIRFLTDYLQNDPYFKTHRPDHNLDRALNQLTLYRVMREQESAMRQQIDVLRRSLLHG